MIVDKINHLVFPDYVRETKPLDPKYDPYLKDVELEAYFQEVEEEQEKESSVGQEFVNSEAIILSSMNKDNAVEKRHWRYKA